MINVPHFARIVITTISGEPYPDFPIIELETKSEMMLSDLVKKAGAHPIVLNFGSCS